MSIVNIFFLLLVLCGLGIIINAWLGPFTIPPTMKLIAVVLFVILLVYVVLRALGFAPNLAI